MVLAQVVAHAGADVPEVRHLVAHVQLDRGGFDATLLREAVALGRDEQAFGQRQRHEAAEVVRVLERGLARRGVAGLQVLHVEAEAFLAPLDEVAEAHVDVGAVGARVSVDERGTVGAGERIAAVVGLQRTGNEAFALAGLHLEPGVAGHAQRQVGRIQAAVGVAFVVLVGREPELDVVVEPVLPLAAHSHGIEFVEARRVFVAHDDVGLVAAHAAAAHEQVVARGRRQRLGEHQPALQVVDVVVHARAQVHDARDDAGGLVAQLDTHAFGAAEQVLVMQVVERAAGAAEFLVARHRAGLGRETVEREAPLAEAGRRLGGVVRVGAVEATVDLRQFVAGVAHLEVAPEAVVLALAGLDVELAERRRHFLDHAVVAERRVVVVGIDATEQRVRRLVEEVAEQVLDRRFFRVGARDQFPVLAELAVDVEREATVGRGIEVARCIRTLQRLGRAVRARLGERDVRHADVEPVVALELEVAQVQRAVARVVEQGHFDRVCAVRQDFLGDEVAVHVDRDFAAGHPDRVVRGHTTALHLHRAAAERDVVQGECGLAVGGQQFALGRACRGGLAVVRHGRLLADEAVAAADRRRRRDVDHVRRRVGRFVVDPQRLRRGLVEVSVGVVGPQHEPELVRRIGHLLRARLPLGEARRVNRHHGERRGA